MKSLPNILILSALFFLCVDGVQDVDAKPIHAPGRFGIGLGSGTFANGISLKYFMAESIAIQGNIGSSGGSGSNRFKDNGGIAASGDVLIENGPLLASDLLTIDWSYGVGAGLSNRNDNFAIAAAGILGLELNLKIIPVDLVLEFRPALLISPDIDLDIVDFTGHIRFYFQ